MKRLLCISTILTLGIVLLVGCGGRGSMDTPGAGNEGRHHSQSADSTVTAEESQQGDNQPLLYRSSHAEVQEERSNEQDPNEVPDIEKSPEPVEQVWSFGSADLSDSASAVDDDIWRKFELAEEYHLMGVMANREASWEEAQYFFEKGLRILAKLDIETDSVATPEGVKYNRLLDNFVADYRVTLRSLGHLEPDVSSSVIIERFGDLARNPESDSVRVFGGEKVGVVYDLPVVMNDRVKRSIVYFQTVAKGAFTKYLVRSKRYTPMMSRIIAEYGLPQDLIYLSLVESGYNPNAYSWARAMGLWQFIASTGRMYNLNRNWWMDERKDPVKSTHAACQFLKHLYEKFGHWELAMAAYNGGPGRVSRTIKKQKTNDFWKMKLRRQTMDYVPLIYAAAIIAKNPEKYGFTDIETEPEVVWDEVEINRCLELSTVARELGTTTAELKRLNPELLRKYTPPKVKRYKLKIPVGSKQKFLAAYDKMPSPQETSWVRHKIRRGETISTIASRYGVSQYAILEANNLSRRSTIFAGKELIVPVPLDHGQSSSSSPRKNKDYTAKNSIYSVRRGDTMWDIARAFGTTVDALRRINYIQRGSRIYVGQKLKLPSSAKQSPKSKSQGSSTYASNNKPQKTSSGGTKSHKVRPGDTIWDIARKYGTTSAKIRTLNGLGRSSRIYPGQLLKVADGSSSDYIVHKIRRGDTLSRIAQKYRTSISRIISANDLDDPDELTVGTKLKIYVK
ncbi:MAG: LysM peptidoglycan-binding domain-containing protein [candidate division Zixibacteria bacterium]|nr:LysM peptidoglycan-binding domain-containing protein [candidate division Zixibacteria bacterium]